MVRLTVLYNLAPGTKEEAFLKWRLTEHQDANQSIPGVICTDFARVDEVWPGDTLPPYRFMTTADWADMESFRQGFYDPEVQAGLQKNLELLSDPLFLISEVLT